MKKIIVSAVLTAMFLALISCSSSKETLSTDASTRTMIATVLAQKDVLIGEYEEGSRVVEGNLSEKILTWEGFHLLLRSEDGQTYEYLSNELFFEGDRLIIRVQDGKVISVKFAP